MLGVWKDARIGGRPVWRYCDDRDLMRVPEELRDCTCFILTLRASGATSISTAFFLGVPLGVHDEVVQDQVVCYLVTAKHCLYDEHGTPDEVIVWLNTRAGATDYIRTDPSQWIEHASADVAAIPLLPDRGTFGFRVYPASSAATRDFIVKRSIGPGDEVFITGLLVHHPGRTRIMPIVRLGSIAALPEDPITLKLGRHATAEVVDDVVALLEVRSIGGLSGSPVYLHLPFWRDTNKGDLFVGRGATAASGGENWLLGVMHGFYPIGQNDPDNVSGNEDLNTGIAVVVLADRVFDIVNHPDQVRMREALKKNIKRGQMPTPAAGTPDKQSEFDRFEELARKIVAVSKKELDEKREQT